MTAQELGEFCEELALGMYAQHPVTYVHPAVLHLVNDQRHDCVFFPDFGSEASKIRLRALCMTAAATGVAGLLAFCCEGWSLKGKSEAELMAERHSVMGDVSLHPNRREVLSIDVASPDGPWAVFSEIERKGEHVTLKRMASAAPGPEYYNRYLSDLPWKKGGK